MSVPPSKVPAGRTAAVVTPLGGSFAKAELTSQERELWNPWTSGDRVGTTADEHRFIAELRVLVAAQPPTAVTHHRLDVTAVITSTRR